MSRNSVAKEVYFSLLPTKLSERLYGFIDFLSVQIAFGIAAWFFLVGGFTGLWVKATHAVPIILFGNVIPLLLISPLAVIFARYGVEQFIGHRAVFGPRGGDIWLLIYVTSSIGWIAYAALLMGSGMWKLLASMNVSGPLASEYPGMMIWAFIATVLGGYLAWRGPSLLKWAMRIASAFLITTLLFLVYIVIWEVGLAEIVARPPPEPFEELSWSIASAIEVNVGLGFSWAFWYGQWTRLAKTERAAFHGCWMGWGILSCTAGIFSALTAIVVGSFDPTDWIAQSRMPIVPLIGLLLIAVANVSSIALLIYPLSLTSRSRFPSIKWTYVVSIFVVAGIILEAIPGVFESYYIYLAYIALLTGIYGGIMVGDYILTRGSYSLRGMYDRKRGYRYWKGINLYALIATIVGTIFYLVTLEPISWTSANGLFPYITAGIPSYFVALTVYVILSKSRIFEKFGIHEPNPYVESSESEKFTPSTSTNLKS